MHFSASGVKNERSRVAAASTERKRALIKGESHLAHSAVLELAAARAQPRGGVYGKKKKIRNPQSVETESEGGKRPMPPAHAALKYIFRATPRRLE